MHTPLSSSLAARPLAAIVKDDPRSGVIFERYRLDYCCHGDETLEAAARKKGVPLAEVVQAIEALGSRDAADRADNEWADLAALTRHIVDRHHRYVREAVPAINAWLDKLAGRHGAGHPELAQVRDTFRELSEELFVHMAKEENLLFPFIDDLAAAARTGGRLPRGPFGTILHPVRVMEADHEAAGELLERLHELTSGYTPPPDACATYQLCYGELKRFETDLHRHVHLENSVLFPRAIELEGGLT